MPLTLIGYAYGRAARDPGCEMGPALIQNSPLLIARNLSINWLKSLENQDQSQGLAAQTAVTELNTALAQDVYSLAKKGSRFLVIGGDHSSAIGTWSGAASALNTPLGLLWVDAHLDSHTPKTSHSKNIHGMPLAVLLGYGDTELTHIQSPKPKISPENLVVVGIRSFETEEHELLKSLDVKIFYMADIEREGFKAIMQKATAIISAKTKAFGISIDLDGLDPKEVPGVASKEPEGIKASEFLAELKNLVKDPHLIGAEIAEFNPKLDEHHKTEKLIVDIIEILC